MPEGDTLYRTAEVLRRTLREDIVRAARGQPGGAQLSRVVGARITTVRTQGKHLLIDFDEGLTLHTHLQMNGTWHRYRPGERWQRDPDRAVAVIETDHAVAVCFDAPTIELLDSRSLALHPVLAQLGPDLLDPDFDVALAWQRLQGPTAKHLSIAEALLEQRVVAGIGNVYRSEALFIERVDPFMTAWKMPRTDLESLLRTAIGLLRANLAGGRRVTMPDTTASLPGLSGPLRRDARKWVYRRAGLPCRRCATPIKAVAMGQLPRRLYWCPRCQAAGPAT